MTANSPPVLFVENLRIETTEGVEIVDEVSLEVREGEVLGLVGESGCGKTSTAFALLGHARPGTRIAGGRVVVEGRDILTLDRRALSSWRGARISYVPQDPGAGLNPRHRIGRQVLEALVTHGTKRSAAQPLVRDLLARVGLPTDASFLRRYPFELSGGQQQRVAIAMALICRPAVVVLDEPTTGLDVTTQARVLRLIRELGQQTRAAFVYITHDLAVVDDLADRVSVMYAGRIVESGRAEELFRRPQHPYTTMLLASVPRLSVRRHLVGIAGTAPAPGARPHGCFFEPRCPLAVEQCRETFPPLEHVAGDPTRTVRCWRATEAGSLRADPLTRVGRAARANAVLLVDDLVASYAQEAGRQLAVEGLSFSIARGECLALVGESGSGKTTTGRCVVGSHQPDRGSIMLQGRPLAARARNRTRADRQAIQIIFQNPDRSLNPRETVVAALGRPLRLFGLAERKGVRRKALELVERVRLPSKVLDRFPGELSGGEKQRVAIARALAAQPLVLVCDEITSSLDVSVQAAVVALLDELRQDGLALLFITHNLALVHSIADEILVLQAGLIRDYGPAEQVIRQPSHQYTRELLAAAPDLEVA